MDRKIHTALLQYSFAAELGYEVAQSNVAYLLDRGKNLEEEGEDCTKKGL